MTQVGLMDCNNFFVSCERLFRPDLLKKPVAVLSSNDGCVVARSQEVKDLGIPMGIPYFQIKAMCEDHHITIFSSNFRLYHDVSRRVMHALRTFFNDIEPYSVDEAFFNVPNETSLEDIEKIRAEILKITGIPVSFGIGATKTIAKIASTYAKKGTGVRVFSADDVRTCAPTISCGSVWGLGRETSKKLADMHIHTVQDFLSRDIYFYRNHFGVQGERLYYGLSGKNVYEYQKENMRKSYTSTRSFPRTIAKKSLLQSALGYHVSHVGEMLRKNGVCAQTLTVLCFPSGYDHYSLQKQSLMSILSEPTNDTVTLLHEAESLLSKMYTNGVAYKKVGVVCGSIISAQYISQSLFTVHKKDSESVYKVVDAINTRFGCNTIHAGSIYHQELWREQANKKSSNYTTEWSEIARVKAI